MGIVLNWVLFAVIAGPLIYLAFFHKKQGAQQRGRPVHRGTGKAPVQWSDDEVKPKAGGKANKAKAPRKSVKTAVKDVANKVETSLSTASGADADDDSSPATSPSNVKAPSGRDVSDMLEPQAAKTVLKINASEKQARPAKPQQQRVDSQTETKKQRQNKKKNDEAKAAREAAEEERKKLLEQQRRTAREARGEPARNGLVGAKVPASNAWKAAPAVQAVPAGGQLLDTMDNSSNVANGAAPTSGSTTFVNLPSEEDQIRMAMADSAWTTVPKGRKKAKKDTTDTGSESGNQQEPAPAVKPVAVKPAPAKKVESAKPATRYDVLSERLPEVSDPRDSDWPVV